MSRRRTRLIVVNGVLLVGVAAVGLFAYRAIAGGGTPSQGGVRTATVARGTVLETVSASGTVASARTMDLNFSTGGKVSEIDVQAGQTVKRGEVLAKVRVTASERQQLVFANANLAAALANLDSVQSSSSPTDVQLTQAKASVASARLAVYQAEAQIDGGTLKAPMAGTVVSVSGSVRDSVISGTSSTVSAASSTGSGSTAGGFIVLSDLSHLVVSAYFSETDTAKVGVGDQVGVTLDALPDTQLEGSVQVIDTVSTVVNNVVDYGVMVELSNAPDGIRPGQTANVQVTVARADSALYVPTAAVQTAGGSATVIVLTGGRQTTTTVTLGVQGDQTTQILSGLSEGDQVVIPSATSATGFPGGGFPGFGGGGGGGGP
jgi:macrolide-specific efflux system membrane fusion protein